MLNEHAAATGSSARKRRWTTSIACRRTPSASFCRACRRPYQRSAIPAGTCVDSGPALPTACALVQARGAINHAHETTATGSAGSAIVRSKAH